MDEEISQLLGRLRSGDLKAGNFPEKLLELQRGRFLEMNDQKGQFVLGQILERQIGQGAESPRGGLDGLVAK
jgi:hypothetical protein